MCRYHAKYFSFLLFIGTSIAGYTVSGQTSTVSNPISTKENMPYSRFGIGELYNGNNTVLQGMGNITSAYAHPYQINADNPASYSFLRLTTYEAGGQGIVRNATTSSASYTTGTATISYLAIGLPVGKSGGISFGLRPYARSFYNLTDTVNTLLGKTQMASTGLGSINYAYIGGAYQYKGFSLGFNFGYLFGNYRTTTGVINLDTGIAFNPYILTERNVGGIYWKGGAMYEGKVKKDMTLRVGATLTLGQDINARRNEAWIGVYNYGDTLIQDTAYSAVEQKGKISLPMSYSVGVQLAGSDKWMVGLDYSGTQWSQFRSFGVADDSLRSATYRIGLGGSYTPNPTAIRNYFSRVTYRLGFYYGVSNVFLRNTSLPVYGVTVGGSFPFRRTTSQVHASVDIGRAGTTANGLIQETYVRFTFGFTFNDKWFIKRKYE